VLADPPPAPNRFRCQLVKITSRTSPTPTPPSPSPRRKSRSVCKRSIRATSPPTMQLTQSISNRPTFLRRLIRWKRHIYRWSSRRPLLKLGFEVAESTVSKYMVKHRGPPSQTWRTFLHNHTDAIAAVDLCLVPTVTFECLFAFLVVSHSRRQLCWFAIRVAGSSKPSDLQKMLPICCLGVGSSHDHFISY